MSAALGDKLARGELIDAKDTESTTNSKVLVILTNSNTVQLISLASIRTALKDCLSISLPEVPVSDLSFLSN